MTPNLTLVLVASLLIGTGVYLFLARSLLRALMGFLMMGNGINLLFIIGSGPSGAPPIVDAAEGEAMADPVPQALVLTAIVITLAMTAFVLSLAHRNWQLGREDLVDDDTESARIHARAEADQVDGPSAREQADEITAESQRTEREMIEASKKGQAVPGDPTTPTTERHDHAIAGPGKGTVDPQDVAEQDSGDDAHDGAADPHPDGDAIPDDEGTRTDGDDIPDDEGTRTDGDERGQP